MLRSFKVLLLISLLACTQYARQAAYIRCVFLNTRSEIKCDCEAEKDTATQNSQLPANKHTHITVDDYAFTNTDDDQMVVPASFPSQLTLPSALLIKGILYGIFHPPRFSA